MGSGWAALADKLWRMLALLVVGPWAGVPVRWCGPLVVSSLLGAWLPALFGDPLMRVTSALASWVALQAVMRGRVVCFLVVYLFAASMGSYVFGIVRPLVMGRQGGLQEALAAAFYSTQPGFLDFVRGINSIAYGPGVGWAQGAYIFAFVIWGGNLGSHVYDDFQDFLSFRYRIRAPVWMLLGCGVLGSVASELIWSAGGILHLVGAFAGMAVGAAVWGVVEGLTRSVFRLSSLMPVWLFAPAGRNAAVVGGGASGGRSLRSAAAGFRSAVAKRVAVLVGNGPTSLLPVVGESRVAAAVVDQPVVGPAVSGVVQAASLSALPSETLRPPGLPGPEAVGAGTKPNEDGERSEDGRAPVNIAVHDDRAQHVPTSGPEEGPENAAGSSDEIAVESSDGGGLNGEAVGMDSGSDNGAMAGASGGDSVAARAVRILYDLTDSLHQGQPQLFAEVLQSLSEAWQVVDHDGVEGDDARSILTEVGKAQIGLVVLKMLADGVSVDQAFARAIEAAWSGAAADPNWTLDMGLRPVSSLLAQGVGGPGDSAADLQGGGTRPRGSGDEGLVPAAGSAAFYDGDDQAPPPSATPALGRALTAADGGNIVPFPEGSSGMKGRPQPLVDPVGGGGSPAAGLASAKDVELGIGESGSVERTHPFEVGGDPRQLLEHTKPMAAEEMQPFIHPMLFARPDAAAGSLASMLAELTPEAESLRRFMDKVSEWFGALRITDATVSAQLCLGLADLMHDLPVADRDEFKGRLAYALCGPWRRRLHADVGLLLADQFPVGDVGEVLETIERLVASSDYVGQLFTAGSMDSGSAASRIVERRDALAAMRSRVARASAIGRSDVQSRDVSRSIARAQVLKGRFEPLLAGHVETLERLATLREGLQAIITTDSVNEGLAQDQHPMFATVADIEAQGVVLLERIERASASHLQRSRMPAETDLLMQVMPAYSGVLLSFVVALREILARPNERPVSSRERIGKLRLDLERMREAESDRLAASRLTREARVQAEWSRLDDTGLDAIRRRRAIDDELALSKDGERPESMLIQLRDYELPSGLSGFIHEAGTGVDTRRVLLVPLIGMQQQWQIDSAGFTPTGLGFMRFDLCRFAEEHRSVLRAKRIQDIKVLLLGGSVTPDVEALALSRNLQRDRDITREEATAHWWRGSVVLADDLVGSRGGVALPSGMYFVVADFDLQPARAAVG